MSAPKFKIGDTLQFKHFANIADSGTVRITDVEPSCKLDGAPMYRGIFLSGHIGDRGIDRVYGTPGKFYEEELTPLAPAKPTLLPAAPAERKKYPIVTGFLDYFPSACLEVAKVSYEGNKQHNPGQPLHWARGKSMDQEDTTVRHLMERTEPDDITNESFHLSKDSDGVYHMAKACWRMLAIFQLALEREGAPLARGARMPIIGEEKKS